MNSEETFEARLRRVVSTALEGTPAAIDDCLALAEGIDGLDHPRLALLCEAAHAVRRAQCGGAIATCSIVNGRSGRCSEDCAWCSQAASHHTGCEEYLFVPSDTFVAAALTEARRGVERISIVCSGRKVGLGDIAKYGLMYARARQALDAEQLPMQFCASMGLLNLQEMQALRQAGVSRYHCNLETAPEFFPRLCSSHSYADKLRTIAAARAAGLEVCSGGIIGMGESLRQRLELAEAVRHAGAVSMPVNLLNPIPGTPLERQPLLQEWEVVLTVALMRLVAPRMVIRFAGGRRRLSRQATERMLRGGANGAMVGDMLTTPGNDADTDMAMLRTLAD